MAKGPDATQKEVKKPKKDNAAKAAPASLEKGLSATGESGKRKG